MLDQAKANANTEYGRYLMQLSEPGAALGLSMDIAAHAATTSSLARGCNEECRGSKWTSCRTIMRFPGSLERFCGLHLQPIQPLIAPKPMRKAADRQSTAACA